MTCGAISPVVLKKAVPSGNVMFGRHDGPPSRGPVAVLVTTSHRENVADGPGRKMTLSGAPGPLPAETSSGLHGICTTATMEWPTSTAEKGQRAAGQTTNSHHASGVAVAGVAAVDGTAGRMKPANGSMQSGRAPAMGTTMSPFRPATAADPRLPGPGQRIDLRNPDAPRGSENRQRDREQNRPDHPAVAAGDGGGDRPRTEGTEGRKTGTSERRESSRSRSSEARGSGRSRSRSEEPRGERSRSRRDDFTPVSGRYDEDDEGLEFLGVEEAARDVAPRQRPIEDDDVLAESGLSSVLDVPSWVEAIGIVIAGNLAGRNRGGRNEGGSGKGR